MDSVYIAIDMKSFYASVECVARGLDPLTTDLLVADTSRSDNTICLAVSPSLKAKGVPSRPRLFEAKQAIRRYEVRTGDAVQYLIAVPRMAEYERVSAQIYEVYLRFAAAQDIHVYSIDESFIYCTPYLHAYEAAARARGMEPARLMAMTILREVLDVTGITATVGIGTNLYLAKVAMDIVAKKAAPDADGVRIAELNEDSYKFLLWEHEPLTDFWQIGRGKARRLHNAYMYTMGDVAARSQWDEEWFYRTFGIDGEILVDHAWGVEPVTMEDIKGYQTASHSLSHGQVLSRPYDYEEARNVFFEMIGELCAELLQKHLVAPVFTWWVGYDHRSLETVVEYDGGISVDFYGRLHPSGSKGTVRMPERTNSLQRVSEALLKQFDERTDPRLLYRRIGVCAADTSLDDGLFQLDLFEDYDALEQEKRVQNAMLEVRARFGANALFKANDLLKGATARERNGQIGGHKA